MGEMDFRALLAWFDDLDLDPRIKLERVREQLVVLATNEQVSADLRAAQPAPTGPTLVPPPQP